MMVEEQQRRTHEPWIPDSARRGCGLCQKPFTFCNRRHHCRSCGEVCCHKCSSSKFPLVAYGREPVRVCDDCFRTYSEFNAVAGQVFDELLVEREIKPFPRVTRWVPDSASPACAHCDRPFTCCRRRHHCRSCGKSHCNRCTGKTRKVAGYSGVVRVCDACAARPDRRTAPRSPLPSPPMRISETQPLSVAADVNYNSVMAPQPGPFAEEAGGMAPSPPAVIGYQQHAAGTEEAKAGHGHGHGHGGHIGGGSGAFASASSSFGVPGSGWQYGAGLARAQLEADQESAEVNLGKLEGSVPLGLELTQQLLEDDKILLANQKAAALEHVMVLLSDQLRGLEQRVATGNGRGDGYGGDGGGNGIGGDGTAAGAALAAWEERARETDVDHCHRIRQLLRQYKKRKSRLRRVRSKAAAVDTLLQQFGAYGWNPLDREGEVAVFVREEPGSSTTSFKVEGSVQLPLDQLLSLFLEPATMPAWFPTLTACTELAHTSRLQKILHLHAGLPSLSAPSSSSSPPSPPSPFDCVLHTHFIDLLEQRQFLCMVRSINSSPAVAIPPPATTPLPGVTRLQLFGGILFSVLSPTEVRLQLMCNAGLAPDTAAEQYGRAPSAAYAPNPAVMVECGRSVLLSLFTSVQQAAANFKSCGARTVWKRDATGVYGGLRSQLAPVMAVISPMELSDSQDDYDHDHDAYYNHQHPRRT